MAETSGKKLKKGRRKISWPEDLVAEFCQTLAKNGRRGRRKFKFAEFGHLLDAALCFKLKQPATPPPPPNQQGDDRGGTT
jgi:hypothetical protein